MIFTLLSMFASVFPVSSQAVMVYLALHGDVHSSDITVFNGHSQPGVTGSTCKPPCLESNIPPITRQWILGTYLLPDVIAEMDGSHLVTRLLGRFQRNNNGVPLKWIEDTIAGDAFWGGAVKPRVRPRSAFQIEGATGPNPSAKLEIYKGTLHVNTDYAIISNMEIIGDVVIDAKNVKLSNIRLISDTPWHALRVMDDASGFMLADSEIDGRGTTNNAIYGFGTFLRADLHGVENGITVTGPAVIHGNYIHDLQREGSDPHYDGIQMTGGHDVEISENTIVNDHPQTSAISMGNTTGDLSRIVISGNRLIGGGYTVQIDGRKGVGVLDSASIEISDNRIGGGAWGNSAFWNASPVTFGNTDLSATHPVELNGN